MKEKKAKPSIVKIRIGVPSYSGKISKTTSESIEETLKNCKDFGFSVDVMMTKRASCCNGRNKCITQSQLIKQKFPFDYYYSIDADMGFSAQTIYLLLRKNLPIVGAAYISFENPSQFVGGKFGKIIGDTPTDLRASALIRNTTPVDWIGGGSMLISSKVLEKMEYPYFRNTIIKKDDCQEYTTEDIGFCIEAKKAGFNIYLAADVYNVHASSEVY